MLTNSEIEPCHGPVVGHKDGFDIIDCQVCGFKHIMPLPTEESLKTLYEEAFYQADKDAYLRENEEDLAWKRLEMQDRVLQAETLLASDMPRRALDIGTGPGTFLDIAVERGWQASGIEPSPVAADYCRSRGLDVTTGFFGPETPTPDTGYSFVHMSEVLEHIANPLQTLGAAYDWLLPGGIIALSVPNDYNPLQQAAQKAHDLPAWWEAPDHHINYFSHDSLAALVEKVGFHEEARDTNFPMEMFLLMGDVYIGDGKTGRALHSKRKAFDLALADHAPDARTALYQALAHAGLGRLAIIYARKPL